MGLKRRLSSFGTAQEFEKTIDLSKFFVYTIFYNSDDIRVGFGQSVRCLSIDFQAFSFLNALSEFDYHQNVNQTHEKYYQNIIHK
ncbi:hypothetical protein BpHYR1_014944 [Brachionus plicatilis]|uniref:Uncharacterized protein n=1 Tax=Brachionus plicatilis TaxID=10195 RepID=A0A3M7PV76_BRAPC|nr:hypothetical protein BpHYR1_014944 [Brachionus plicatilis]